MKLSEIQAKPPKILIYGPPGTGKTALALTLGARLHIIDCDDGLRSGLTYQDEFTKDRHQVDFDTFIDKKPLVATAYQQVIAHIIKLSNQLVTGKCPFQAIALDSLSTYAELVVRGIMTSSGKYQTYDPPSMPVWGLAELEIKKVVDFLRSFPTVVILIAHTQIVTIDDKQKERVGIFGKNLPTKVPGVFDEVWYAKPKAMAGGKTGYVLQTQQTASVMARTRSQLPNETNMNLGMVKILDMMGYQFPEQTVVASPINT